MEETIFSNTTTEISELRGSSTTTTIVITLPPAADVIEDFLRSRPTTLRAHLRVTGYKSQVNNQRLT